MSKHSLFLVCSRKKCLGLLGPREFQDDGCAQGGPELADQSGPSVAVAKIDERVEESSGQKDKVVTAQPKGNSDQKNSPQAAWHIALAAGGEDGVEEESDKFGAEEKLVKGQRESGIGAVIALHKAVSVLGDTICGEANVRGKSVGADCAQAVETGVHNKGQPIGVALEQRDEVGERVERVAWEGQRDNSVAQAPAPSATGLGSEQDPETGANRFHD